MVEVGKYTIQIKEKNYSWNNTTDKGINEMTNLKPQKIKQIHITKSNITLHSHTQSLNEQNGNIVNHALNGLRWADWVSACRYLSFNYNSFGNIARRLSNYARSSLFCLIGQMRYSCHMHANKEKHTRSWENMRIINDEQFIDMNAFSVSLFFLFSFHVVLFAALN